MAELARPLSSFVCVLHTPVTLLWQRLQGVCQALCVFYILRWHSYGKDCKDPVKLCLCFTYSGGTPMAEIARPLSSFVCVFYILRCHSYGGA